MSYLIVNDNHLGLKRKSGATQESMNALHDLQIAILWAALEKSTADTLIVLADLFADAFVEPAVLWQAYQTLMTWGGKIYLVIGNHDVSKDRSKMSSLEFLARLLPNAVLIDKPQIVDDNFAVVPHLLNQEEFDNAVAWAAEESTILLAHCNYDNFFAAEKDHSLNLTPEQAKQFDLVILGHEHVKRTVGNVHVLGSPLPCNISEAEHDHWIHEWDGAGAPEATVQTFDNSACAEIDWRDLAEIPPGARFVRVVGSATATEAAQVIQEISRFRSLANDVFMITNSVRVDGVELGSFTDEDSSLESFDPMAVLMEVLAPEYRARLVEIKAPVTGSGGR